MKTRLPTSDEIEALVAFLARLYTDGFTPIKCWRGGTQKPDTKVTMPWPEYEEPVKQFFDMASSPCWCDYGYRPKEASVMLENQDTIKQATLPQIKTMLTYCVRGERFCDGHWARMIENGSIRRLLERLVVLGSTYD